MMMITSLRDADPETCGSKAATLGALLRGGLPVPDGFVVPFAVRRLVEAGHLLPGALRAQVEAALAQMGNPAVAVRSSALGEDAAGASAAGQYESVLAVRGVDAVIDALGRCWASASSSRVASYRHRTAGRDSREQPEIAVLVQRLVDADVSGVMFTPAHAGDHTRIEASWGLGLTVVGGIVTPDAYEVTSDGAVRCTIGSKTKRMVPDAEVNRVATYEVDALEQGAATLDETTALRLAALGTHIADLCGCPQDVEWAIADHMTWVLQSRPVTAPVPAAITRDSEPDGPALIGTPASGGVATGTARIVRSPNDFGRVRPGDIVICPHTDPAWTPLFTIAGGVVTEVGGALSHAAIVAREYGIPAVLGVPRVTERIADGARVEINGTTGTLAAR